MTPLAWTGLGLAALVALCACRVAGRAERRIEAMRASLEELRDVHDDNWREQIDHNDAVARRLFWVEQRQRHFLNN